LRLPDYVKATVCFLCVEANGQTLFGGTGFFVTLKSETHLGLYFSYLVTAKHCVLKAYQRYGHLKARSNLRDRTGTALVNLDEKEWVFPEDPGIDIATMSVNVHPSIEVLTLPCEHLASSQSIEDFGIGIGDETIAIGLFTQRSGKRLNIPILRSGIISAMPEEALFDAGTGAEFHAYLVEMRSIGGLSGSPVFVSVPSHRARGFNVSNEQTGYSLAVGVIRGHWEMTTQQDDSLEDFINEGRVNMGIAMVTPIQEVTNLVMTNAKLKASRDSMEKQHEAGQMTIEDVPFKTPDSLP
jgi:hypothetical protein